MKKTLNFVLSTCVSLLVCMLIFTACNNVSETQTPYTTTDATTTVDGVVTTDPEVNDHVHAFGEWTSSKDATCTEKGEKERVCACGEKETQAVDALGHTEVVDQAVASTCTAEGKTEGKHCSVCNEVLVAQTAVKANGHTEVVDQAVAATCIAAGKTEGKHCSVCNEVLKAQESVAALGHAYDDEYDTNCNTCGFVRDALCAHTNLSVIDAVPATCTANGLTVGKKCVDCQEIIEAQQVVSATGHTEVVDKAVAATCTADGKTEGKHCSVCNTVLVAQTTVKAKGHTEVVDKAVAATCTADGKTEGKHCSVCNTVLVAQTTVKAKGHTEVVDKAVVATCTAAGKTEGKHCSVCNTVLVAQTTVKAKGHTEVVDKAVVATCTAAGKTEGKHCSVCNTVLVAQTTVKAKGHTEVVDKAVAATCTADGKIEGKHCSVCNTVLVAQTTVKAKGHIEVIDKAVEPTYSNTGLTQGSHCSVCNTVLIPQNVLPVLKKYDDPKLYNDDYGYRYLGTMAKGTALQKLYNLIDEAAYTFHTDANITATDNVVGTFNYASLGLSTNDALAVWITYKNDHPLYYWISNSIKYTGTDLILLTEDEYASGKSRANLNKLVYDSVKEYTLDLSGETSSYRIALALHDSIIFAIDYAYEEDGFTPQDDAWAHSILGVFEKQSGVCESYAKTFQLLLNFLDVDNVFVTGTSSGSGHAWNLVEMDDGQWYWFDLTWDDTPNWMWGVKYNYFCVNDTQNTSWSDGGSVTGSSTFIKKHTYSLPTDSGIDFLYGLPNRGYSVYRADELMLRETFALDGFEYAMTGYNTVALTKINIGGEVIIPETVVHDGICYKVTSIGVIKESLFQEGLVTELSGVKSVTIPKTVCFIWDRALFGLSIEAIYVDVENPYFTSEDGVLFTKSKYTLIQYPRGNQRSEYTIPNEVNILAADNFLGTECLEKLHIGANVDWIGYCNWGSGYRDHNTSSGGSTIADQLISIYITLNGAKEITIDPENRTYVIYNNTIYNYDMTHLFLVMEKEATTLHISSTIESHNDRGFAFAYQLNEIIVDGDNGPYFSYDGVLYKKKGSQIEIIYIPKSKSSVVLFDGLTSIGDYAFSGCSSLTSITIPGSVTSIGICAFDDCSSLTSITIPGSVTSIGICAFDDCSSLTSVTIYGSVTSIGERAFDGCSSLTSITIPGSVTSIGERAFSGCSSLTSITIPSSVTSIGERAFSGCSSLTSVTIHDGVTIIGRWAFDDCSSLTNITISGSVTSIGDSAFGDCSSLTSVTIYGSVTSIGDSAFGDCSSLTSVTIHGSVTSMGSHAFSGCSSLTSITIPDGVTSIGYAAFYGCESLTSVTIPNSVTSIDDFAFYGCSGLTSITIPNSVTSIGDFAFDSCESLTSIIFGGTKAQWEEISKSYTWDWDTGNYTVYCTDGLITK